VATVLGCNRGFHTAIDSFVSSFVVLNLLLSSPLVCKRSGALGINRLMRVVIGCGLTSVG